MLLLPTAAADTIVDDGVGSGVGGRDGGDAVSFCCASRENSGLILGKYIPTLHFAAVHVINRLAWRRVYVLCVSDASVRGVFASRMGAFITAALLHIGVLACCMAARLCFVCLGCVGLHGDASVANQEAHSGVRVERGCGQRQDQRQRRQLQQGRGG